MRHARFNPTMFNFKDDFVDFFEGQSKQTSWNPRVDIQEDDNQYLFFLELPGVSKDDIKITTFNDLLTISGEKTIERADKNYHRKERFSGSYNRSFQLPTIANLESVNAKYTDGVLLVTVLKKDEAKKKEITVD